MTDSRYLTLALRLRKRSREGKIDWQETSTEGVYQAGFGDLTIAVVERFDADYPENPDYVLRILNEEGRLVEEFSNSDLRDFTIEGGNAYQLMQELYTSARRTAMGVEQALHTLLEELGDDE